MIILLGYESGAGKNTVGDLLHSLFRMKYPNRNVVACSFASQLKEDCHRMFGYAGLKDEIYYENNREEKTKKILNNYSPVDIWIKVSEMLKEIDPRMWGRRLFQNHNTKNIVIVRDFRFPVEYEHCDRLDVTLPIHVIRPGVKRQASDNYLDDFTKWWGWIQNNGTLQDLSKNVHAIFDNICTLIKD